MRLTTLQRGIVYGVYFYGCGANCSNDHDEADIEIVTNYLQAGSSPLQVQLNLDHIIRDNLARFPVELGGHLDANGVPTDLVASPDIETEAGSDADQEQATRDHEEREAPPEGDTEPEDPEERHQRHLDDDEFGLLPLDLSIHELAGRKHRLA